MRIAGYGESSGSRAAIGRELASMQRKVVIVIEPLDHTEKSNDKISGVGSDAKTIESVKSTKISDRDISSVRSKDYIIDTTKEVVMEIKNQTEKMSQVIVANINSKLSESMILQRMVDKTVLFELKKKGFNSSEAEKMLKNYNVKNKKVNP